MVDPLPVPVDGPVGRCHAPPCEHSQEIPADSVHACLCRTWFLIRYALRTCAGTAVRLKLPKNDRLDHRGASLRLHPRCQQFLLRDPDPSDHLHPETRRAQYGEGVRSRLPHSCSINGISSASATGLLSIPADPHKAFPKCQTITIYCYLLNIQEST